MLVLSRCAGEAAFQAIYKDAFAIACDEACDTFLYLTGKTEIERTVLMRFADLKAMVDRVAFAATKKGPRVTIRDLPNSPGLVFKGQREEPLDFLNPANRQIRVNDLSSLGLTDAEQAQLDRLLGWRS